ncbi:AraC family transcriptional regulator [Kocuria rhizophila]|uniref:AraC family transcriptional regulator n=1 Tax=Kocuria rhizophila TaxID=72000 RepID=UPI001D00456A
MRLHPGESLADVAVHFDMTDQAHLGREFKSAFGITPGDYRSTCSAAQRHP